MTFFNNSLMFMYIGFQIWNIYLEPLENFIFFYVPRINLMMAVKNTFF